MLTINRRYTETARPHVDLVLPFQLRTKSRLRTALPSGEEVALILERGSILRHGDLLVAEDGRIVRVQAAPETVSTVQSADLRALARVSYHLGNRHVALEIGERWVRYLHDHVLDDMVRGLGLSVIVHDAPFEPEAGAYGGHAALAPHSHG